MPLRGVFIWYALLASVGCVSLITWFDLKLLAHNLKYAKGHELDLKLLVKDLIHFVAD